MDQPNLKRRLTCILAADAVGYSKLMGQDEEGTIQVLTAHRAIIDGIIAFHGGRIVSTAGDSVLAEFTSAVEAVRCAVELQDALKTRNDALPEHRQMLFRVGVNLGDVVVKDYDLLGDGVNVAARLESMAEPGGICIASSVYDQITGKLDLGFQDIGEQNLKNISRPIRVYRVSGAMAPLRVLASAVSSPAAPSPVPPAASASGPHNGLRWVIGAVLVLAVGALGAWQGGWLHSGAANGQAGGDAVNAVVAAPKGPVGVTAVNSALPAVEPVATPLVEKRTRPEGRGTGAVAIAPQVAQAKPSPVQQSVTAPLASPPAAPVLAASAVAAVAPDSVVQAPQTPQGAASSFDGVWAVTVDCPRHEDGAMAYTVDLLATVREGVLRGEFGTEGSPGWLLLRGNIRTDGSASIAAKGLTADPRLSVKSVGKGTPYAYQVSAVFEGARGTGRRLQLRACVLTFVRQ